MFRVRKSALPAHSLLDDYERRGAYTDCFRTPAGRRVTLAVYIEAFYTSPVFRLERWLLARLISKPSTDAESRELAAGAREEFAAWTVETRESDQILLAAGRTRSWLMVADHSESAWPATTLYFGSAIVPQRSNNRLGWRFSVLLGFHRLYSRVLLSAARRRISRLAESSVS